MNNQEVESIKIEEVDESKVDTRSHLSDSLQHVEDDHQDNEELDGDTKNIVDDNGSPINNPVPDVESLNKIKEQIIKMTPEERAEFLAYMAQVNNINPQNQQFSPASDKQILKERLRQKTNKLRNQRMPKLYQKILYEKKKEKQRQFQEKLKGTKHLSTEDNEELPENQESLLTPNVVESSPTNQQDDEQKN